MEIAKCSEKTNGLLKCKRDFGQPINGGVRGIFMSEKNIIETARFNHITASMRFAEFILKETEDSFFAEGETADNMIYIYQ